MIATIKHVNNVFEVDKKSRNLEQKPELRIQIRECKLVYVNCRAVLASVHYICRAGLLNGIRQSTAWNA